MKTLAAILGALVIGVPLMLVLLFAPAEADCSPTGGPLAVTALPNSVAGYDKEQLGNAALVIGAANTLSLPPRAAVVGVMTAMGESSLRNITYGDNAINPDGTTADSIGLFQQQSWWGTFAERMDPTASSTKFFEKLKGVEGWADLEPTIAAHRVQGNSDPRFYTKFLPAAEKVVAALTGVAVSGEGTGTCVGPSGNFAAATGTAPGPWGGFSNGRIDASQLAPVPWKNSVTLRGDALTSLIAMNEAFKREFGYNLTLNSGYRSYADQVIAKKIYGGGAATPGTSNHGWAMAIDIGERNGYVIGFSSPIYTWLKQHASSYGWVHPPWAEPGGIGPDEAWHWEYYGVKR